MTPVLLPPNGALLSEALLFTEIYLLITKICMYWRIFIYLQQAGGFHLPTVIHLMCVVKAVAP